MDWFEINKSPTIDQQIRLSFQRDTVICICEPDEFVIS